MYEFRPQPKPQSRKGKKNKKDRAEFPAAVREEILETYNGLCGHCGRKADHIHHVFGKGAGGRGVLTNGLPLCARCHTQIHMDPDMMNRYKNEFAARYGADYYKDQLDKGDVI